MSHQSNTPTESQSGTSGYKLIAHLVTTYQMDIDDWDLGPMTRKNYRIIRKRIEDHNESLKTLAIELKSLYERLNEGSK